MKNILKFRNSSGKTIIPLNQPKTQKEKFLLRAKDTKKMIYL